ncbi:MAG TPA: hypothetical protein VF832_00625 [Longimicrobiales bacterium]
MDHRRLTFIVVPHADLETRMFSVSYGRMKVLLVGVGALLLVFALVVSTWWYVAAQAARATSLEREVRRLESERANVTRLARELEQVEAQYERVRQLLGADATPAKGKEPILPPIGRKPESVPRSTSSSRRPDSTAADSGHMVGLER